MSAPRDAGRELDALVAEKVMGLDVRERDWPCGYMPDGCELEVFVPPTRWDGATDEEYARHVRATEHHRDSWFDERHPVFVLPNESGWRRVVPFYSTRIRDAWQVVEKVDNRNGVARELGVRTFSLYRYAAGWFAASFVDASVTASTAPLAICLSALAATESHASALSPTPQEEET